MVKLVFSLFLIPSLLAVAEIAGNAQQISTAELITGFSSILLGVAALLIAIGALVVLFRLAKVLEKMEEKLQKE